MKIIISATGNDRSGIVSDISGIIKKYGGNVEESRMIKLGSKFSIIMQISIQGNNSSNLQTDLNTINNLTVVTNKTAVEENANILPYHIYLHGADNEGIVTILTKYLAKKSINIIELNTHISEAPMTGTPLFNLDAQIAFPKHALEINIKDDLSKISKKLGIDIVLTKSD